MLVPFFCGQAVRCQILNDHWALQQAKSNIFTYYRAVGVLERINESLDMFQTKLPAFFDGALDAFYVESDSGLRANSNSDKSEVRDDIKELLRKNLTADFELYYFVNELLDEFSNQ